MRLLRLALLQALAPAGAHRGAEEVVETCWTTMKAAGWTAADQEAAKEEFRKEAQDPSFQARIESRIVSVGTAKPGSSKPTTFEHPKPSHLPDPWKKEGAKTAVFILGPSAVGKSSMSASLAANDGQELGISFPLITHDGADWRDASDVWKKFAQDGGRWEGPAEERKWVPPREGGQEEWCHLEDFYDKIFKVAVEKLHHDLVFKLIEQYQYPTVLVPSVANWCFLPQFKYCKTMRLKKQLEEHGYTASFLVIHADQAKVQQFGNERAAKEGKKYNPSSYLGGVASAAHMYFLNPGKSWSFFFNAFDNQDPRPRRMKWNEYRTQYAKPLLEESGPAWCQDGGVCKTALKAIVVALLGPEGVQ